MSEIDFAGEALDLCAHFGLGDKRDRPPECPNCQYIESALRSIAQRVQEDNRYADAHVLFENLGELIFETLGYCPANYEDMIPAVLELVTDCVAWERFKHNKIESEIRADERAIAAKLHEAQMGHWEQVWRADERAKVLKEHLEVHGWARASDEPTFDARIREDERRKWAERMEAEAPEVARWWESGPHIFKADGETTMTLAEYLIEWAKRLRENSDG